MKRLIRAGNAYIWALVVRQYLGLLALLTAAGAGVAVILYAGAMLL